jgi:transcriptional repressor NrdR
MKCPQCKGEQFGVVDTRPSIYGNSTRRRRKCFDCDHRWTTHELHDEEMKEFKKYLKLKQDKKIFVAL